MSIRKITYVGILFCLCLFAEVAQGQESATDSQRLTLSEVIELTMTNYELVAIGGENVVQGREDIWKILSGIMPNVSVNGRYTNYLDEKVKNTGFIYRPENSLNESTRVDVVLSQPLYSGGRASNAYSQAKKSLEVRQNLFEITKEEIIIAVAASFYDVLKAEGDLQIKQSAYKRAAEYKKAAKLKLKLGSGTKADLLSAEAEEAGAKAELIRAESTLADSYILLSRFIGREYANGGMDLIEPIPSNYELGPIDDYIEKAFANRREIANAEKQKEIASHGVGFVKGHFLPLISAEAQYSYSEQESDTTYLNSERTSASIVMSYPIFEGGLRKAEYDEALSKLRQAELNMSLVRKDIEVEVRRAYNNAVYLRNLIESFSKQKDFAGENYQVVFRQYKVGLAGSVDVTNADSLFAKSEGDYLSVKLDYEVALLNLKKASGQNLLVNEDIEPVMENVVMPMDTDNNSDTNIPKEDDF